MRAMVLERPGTRLVAVEHPDPVPGPGEVRIEVEACAVCRTDLHVIDGELAQPRLPLVPGHEIVGIVDAVGPDVAPSRLGKRVGVPWLGHACGSCAYCRSDAENLCDAPQFTGYTRDGGFATHAVADANFAFDLDPDADPVALAPLLCAGLIGWRALTKAGDGKRIGLYGFGAAAHIITQVCVWQGRAVHAFTRPGDTQAQRFALRLGAVWAGGSDATPIGQPSWFSSRARVRLSLGRRLRFMRQPVRPWPQQPGALCPETGAEGWSSVSVLLGRLPWEARLARCRSARSPASRASTRAHGLRR